MKKNYKVCMTVAGSDPSGGAGLQADLKTFTLMGCYGQAVPTALTVQNTLGVRDVYPVAGNIVKDQMLAAGEDLPPLALKLGMLPNCEVVEAVVDAISQPCFHKTAIILDPIVCSTSGKRLMSENALCAIREYLVPRCKLITPNIDEYELITGLHAENFFKEGKQLIESLKCEAILLKGGHREDTARDILCDGKEYYEYNAPFVTTTNTHGTGCVLSSAIAAGLAAEYALPLAVTRAKEFLTKRLQEGAGYNAGKGKGGMFLI